MTDSDPTDLPCSQPSSRGLPPCHLEPLSLGGWALAIAPRGRRHSHGRNGYRQLSNTNPPKPVLLSESQRRKILLIPPNMWVPLFLFAGNHLVSSSCLLLECTGIDACFVRLAWTGRCPVAFPPSASRLCPSHDPIHPRTAYTGARNPFQESPRLLFAIPTAFRFRKPPCCSIWFFLIVTLPARASHGSPFIRPL